MSLDFYALNEMRSKTVTKANDLIQKSRFGLSLQQQKVVLYLISQITPYDKDFEYYEFNIVDFCRVCGIDADSGGNYSTLKAAIKEIADKSLWVTLDDGRETLLRWIEKPYIDRKSGNIKIRLDKDMKPFLLQLKKNFTTYELFWTLSFKSKYSIRLYELAKSIHYDELHSYERVFKLDDLKRILGAESYKTWQGFKERVFIPAVKEVNELSDKTISYTVIKTGRSVGYIKIKVETKPLDERISLQQELEFNLGLNQLTIWDELKE